MATSKGDVESCLDTDRQCDLLAQLWHCFGYFCFFNATSVEAACVELKGSRGILHTEGRPAPTCPICYQEAQEPTVTPCAHIACCECICHWLQVRRLNKMCFVLSRSNNRGWYREFSCCSVGDRRPWCVSSISRAVLYTLVQRQVR